MWNWRVAKFYAFLPKKVQALPVPVIRGGFKLVLVALGIDYVYNDQIRRWV